ncbi:MAG TPA: hypothetical protein VJS17_05345 [Pyrinomonadaceae bacterium]|nr:hypothetical protein [Pyrinomonadaceae bacterium]
MLNAVTIQLIHDIFGDVNYVLRGAHPVNRHYINWGDNRPGEFTPSSGFTLTADVLSTRLFDLLRWDSRLIIDGESDAESKFDWDVYAANTRRIGNTDISSRRFGQRYAISFDVTLRDDVDCTTSFIEATPRGWLFLAPLGQGRAVLQAVVPDEPRNFIATTRTLLASTKEIKRNVEEFKLAHRPFAIDCAPEKLSRMHGANWLATGTAACSYDPLCGDGTGYAIRAAILAAAVLEGIDRGTTREGLLTYYKLRISYAFYTHLRSCVSLYSTASYADIWRGELDNMEEGISALEKELSRMTTNHYRLHEFELLPMNRSLRFLRYTDRDSV